MSKHAESGTRNQGGTMSVAPGQVWWCDGTELAFEAHFKRRPVLVVAVAPEGQWHVLPLSSSRRYGQEIAVTHTGGVSYMTGSILTVSAHALRKPLGDWDGFPAWQADQDRAAQAMARWQKFRDRLQQYCRLLKRK